MNPALPNAVPANLSNRGHDAVLKLGLLAAMSLAALGLAAIAGPHEPALSEAAAAPSPPDGGLRTNRPDGSPPGLSLDPIRAKQI